MRIPRMGSYRRRMTTTTNTQPVLDDAAAQEMSERLADFFRTTEPDGTFSEDVFLDGHPPLWRFQVHGRDHLAEWYRSYAPDGCDTTVINVVPTATGFLAELVGQRDEEGELLTDRKVVICRVRAGEITELTIYCSGDWDAELRARHAAETTLLRR
jgi:ketosteroid isomerase-like protein